MFEISRFSASCRTIRKSITPEHRFRVASRTTWLCQLLGTSTIFLLALASSLPDRSAHANGLHFGPLKQHFNLPVHQAQSRAGFREISDTATGVQVSLPMGIVDGPTSASWGSNWKASDNRLNIDTLNFRHERTLTAVYSKLRSVKGRRLSTDTFSGSQFLLQGNNSDGTFFYVQCAERSGEVRGISIVYSAWAKAQLAPVVATIVHSLSLFPSTGREEKPYVSATPQEIAANPEIKSLQDQLEALQSKLKSQEEEARRRSEEQRLQARDDEIRRQEREKAQAEVDKVEERIRAERDKASEESRKIEERLRAEMDRRFGAQLAATENALRKEGNSQPIIANLPPGKRVAFVVGINAYSELAAQHQLQRAVNDAKLMRSIFQQLGFEVLPVSENVTRRQFAQAWQNFLRKVEPGSTAAFFFAGHGVEMQGVNYLLPGDIPALQADGSEFLQLEALNFSQLHSDLIGRKPRVSILILDSCRDNPFSVGGGRSLGGRRGLARIDPIEGSFVLYSAAAGEQALDRLPNDPSNEENSVFTRTLAPMLLTPNLTIQEVARSTRRRVAELAGAVNHKQWPAYYDGLTGSACLVGSCGQEAAADRK